jgi:tetratricopeptide (TPR) repeat protein
MRLTQEMKATCIVLGALMLSTAVAQTMLSTQIAAGRDQLARGDFRAARATFAAYAARHPADALAAMGEGDADLGLHQLETAELDYRRAVSIQPELWAAHKKLVLVEARLGRWGEFDRERALLRGARERGAPNITARESDAIDAFTAKGRQWLVREYYEPAGRSEARFNFEHFDAAGHAQEYISLEPKAAAEAALNRDAQVKIGAGPKAFGPVKVWALNWYTGKGHGTIRTYTHGEPTYETVRADVMRWLRVQKS